MRDSYLRDRGAATWAPGNLRKGGKQIWGGGVIRDRARLGAFMGISYIRLSQMGEFTRLPLQSNLFDVVILEIARFR